MGLFKICRHKGDKGARERCRHPWWGSYRGQRVSLARWSGHNVTTKRDADDALQDLRGAIRAGHYWKGDWWGFAAPQPQPINLSVWLHGREKTIRTLVEARAAIAALDAALKSGKFNPAGYHALDTHPRTFRQFANLFVEKYVKPKNLSWANESAYRLKPLLDYFGDHVLVAISFGDVEDFVTELKRPRVVNHQADRQLAPASRNRAIALLRSMLNWAVDRGYLEASPFRRRGTNEKSSIRLEDESASKRKRRIGEDEERRLLAAAPSQPIPLRSMLVAAFDAGMRQGEMLQLQFRDVDLARLKIVLRGETTKSGKTREIPINTTRLKAVLAFQRLDADGNRKSADARVFSNAVGDPVDKFPRRAWETTVLQAHGVTPRRTENKALTPECRAALRAINLRWHDLRHEYASRLVEHGTPLSQVRDLLGHAHITTTERYDNQTFEQLAAAAGRLESGKTFDASAPTFQKLSTDADPPPPAAPTNASKDVATQGDGPPGDRTRDTVIKSRHEQRH